MLMQSLHVPSESAKRKILDVEKLCHMKAFITPVWIPLKPHFLGILRDTFPGQLAKLFLYSPDIYKSMVSPLSAYFQEEQLSAISPLISRNSPICEISHMWNYVPRVKTAPGTLTVLHKNNTKEFSFETNLLLTYLAYDNF